MAPNRIGQYRVIRPVAAGGMGEVYEAEQENPRRRVALKLIRGELISSSAVRRFQYEAEILAKLQHPGIAQIFEAGTHEEKGSKVPFFAMEFITGAKTLQEYVDSQNLPDRQRLELFCQVCTAIHYGHLKGVIHRDLKPGNILVDENNHVKVIDFGLARIVDPNAEQATLHTQTGQLLGTIPYMSPEQVSKDSKDLDSRSDVYALGVILFELLTGRLPYEIRGKSAYEAIHVIRDVPPKRPSSFNPYLRGDLDAIVDKALRKDPESRYQSADELRRDIQSHLTGEPISARPASLLYQLQALGRRHRGAMIGALSSVGILLLGLVISTTLYFRAEYARAEAERQRQTAQAINDFLNQDLLAAADPENTANREITVREALDAASERLLSGKTLEPAVEASIRATLGRTYHSLGDLDKAEPHWREALKILRDSAGSSDRQTLAAANELGLLLIDLGRLEESQELLTETSKLCMRVLGPEEDETLSCQANLALVLVRMGRYKDAERAYAELLETRTRVFGSEHSDTLTVKNNLASLHSSQGRYDLAEGLLIEVFEARKRILGRKHPDTFVAMANLAGIYTSQGRWAESEALLNEVVELSSEILGPEHPHSLSYVNNLAGLYDSQGRAKDAEPLYREVLEISRKKLGKDHHSTMIALNNLAGVLSDLGDDELAEELYREALETRRRVLGPRNPETIGTLNNLGFLYLKLRRFQEAQSLLEEAFQRYEQEFGPEHPSTLIAMSNLGELSNQEQNPDQGELFNRRVLEGARRIFPPGHWFVGVALRRYGVSLTLQKRYLEAEDCLLKSYDLLSQALGTENVRTQTTIRELVRLYENWGRVDHKLSWVRKTKLSGQERLSR